MMLSIEHGVMITGIANYPCLMCHWISCGFPIGFARLVCDISCAWQTRAIGTGKELELLCSNILAFSRDSLKASGCWIYENAKLECLKSFPAVLL